MRQSLSKTIDLLLSHQVSGPFGFPDIPYPPVALACRPPDTTECSSDQKYACATTVLTVDDKCCGHDLNLPRPTFSDCCTETEQYTTAAATAQTSEEAPCKRRRPSLEKGTSPGRCVTVKSDRPCLEKSTSPIRNPVTKNKAPLETTSARCSVDELPTIKESLIVPAVAGPLALIEPPEPLAQQAMTLPAAVQNTEAIPTTLIAAPGDLSQPISLQNFAKLLGFLALLWLLYELYKMRKKPLLTPPVEWGIPELWSLRPSKRGLKETKPSVVFTKPWLHLWPFHCENSDCWGNQRVSNFPYAQQCNEMPATRSYCKNTEYMGVFSYMSCRLVEHMDSLCKR